MTKSAAKSKPAPAPLQIHETCAIALDLLDVDEANVRHVKNGKTIDMLADDIAFRGLLENLCVQPVLSDTGEPTGRFGVIAGGRRLRALQLLAKKKRIEPNQPISCAVIATGSAADHSLAENTFREQLHPLDQFNAIKALVDQGIADAEIARRYHCTEKFVRQRMKLAAASPKLLKAYAADEISLEKLEAFCVTDDHKRQEEIFKALKAGQFFHPSQIRSALTEDSIEANDPRARFVGIDAYREAGGYIMQDLFKEESGPWLEDPDLLNKLAIEKIEAEREAILAKGFKWAVVCLDPNNVDHIKRNLSAIPNLPTGLSRDERAECARLEQEYDELLEKADGYADEDFTDADAERLKEIDPILTEMRNRQPKLSPKQIARTGVIVSIDEDGRLCLEYGFLRPEDVNQPKKAKSKAATADGDEAHPDHDSDTCEMDGDDDDDTDYVKADNNPSASVAGKSLSDSLVRDLTSYRTVALQAALGEDFNTAILAALHALCASIFCRASYKSCVKISPMQLYFRGIPGLEDWPAYKEIQARHDQWAERLPGDTAALWGTLVNLDDHERAHLFAHCISLTIDAVNGNQGRSSSALHSDQLAEAVSLDMKAAGWISTAENYFSRVTKDQIIDAVKEAAPTKAPLIDHLKKQVMAAEAERILKDTDWLPALLRAPFTSAAPESQEAHPDDDASAETPAQPLPAFLHGGVNGASSAPAA